MRVVVDDQSRNVLVFVTSRAEAEAVVSTMKDVASHRAGGMTSENAALNVDSEDPGVAPQGQDASYRRPDGRTHGPFPDVSRRPEGGAGHVP